MRRSAPLWIVFLAACAGTGGTASAPASQTVRVVGAAGTQSVNLAVGADPSSSRTLPYSVEQVWKALPSVFDSVGVPLQTMDPAKRVVGNTGFKIRGRLKNVALSRYIDCGNSTEIGPNADNFEIHMSVIAAVHAEGTGSSVTVTLEAVGKPVNFAQDYSQCRSKSALETRMFDLLAARLAS